MTKHSFIRYIKPNDKNKPSVSLHWILSDLIIGAQDLLQADSCISDTKGKDRRKIRITITVEEIKSTKE